jgi:hypothetical protein
MNGIGRVTQAGICRRNNQRRYLSAIIFHVHSYISFIVQTLSHLLAEREASRAMPPQGAVHAIAVCPTDRHFRLDAHITDLTDYLPVSIAYRYPARRRAVLARGRLQRQRDLAD